MGARGAGWHVLCWEVSLLGWGEQGAAGCRAPGWEGAGCTGQLLTRLCCGFALSTTRCPTG